MNINTFFKNNSSLLLLLGLLNGLIPILYLKNDISGIIISLIFIFIGYSFCDKNLVLKFIILSCVGIILAEFNYQDFSNRYLKQLPSPNHSAFIKATVSDPAIKTKNVKWLPTPKKLSLNINKIKFQKAEKWKPTTGRIKAFLSPDKISYGDKIFMKGTIIRPDASSLIKGSFDYKKYLQSQGIYRIFYPESHKKISNSNIYYKALNKIYSFRNYLVKKLCKDINNNKIKAFISAIFLGYRQGISSEQKNTFMRSGTMHLIAISGLHVGVLSLLFMLLFRVLPLKIRYYLIPLVLFFYILITGFRPSGTRAFIMISIFCFHKANLYPLKPINSISFAAFIILLFNPFSLFSAGFKFSFIITFVLITSISKTNHWLRIIEEKKHWVPSYKTGLFYNLKQKTFLLLVSSIIAGLGSLGLIMIYQKIINPIMPIINFILLPLLLPLFIISGIKLFLLSFFSLNLSILNFFIENIISFIYFVSNKGAKFPYIYDIQYPGVIAIFIFYLLLFFIITINKRLITFSLIILLISLVSIFPIIANFSGGKIFFYKVPGEKQISTVIIPNSSIGAFIIGLPEDSKYTMKSILKSQGVSHIKQLKLRNLNKNTLQNTKFISDNFEVSSIKVPTEYIREDYIKQISKYCKNNSKNLIKGFKNKPALKIPPYNCLFKKDANIIKAKLNNKIFKIQIITKAPGYRVAKIYKNKKLLEKIPIKNSNKEQLFSYSLN